MFPSLIYSINVNEKPVAPIGDGSAAKKGRDMPQRDIIGDIVSMGIVQGTI